MPNQEAGAISAFGNASDVIQDGGRKQKLLLLLDGAWKASLYYYDAAEKISLITTPALGRKQFCS